MQEAIEIGYQVFLVDGGEEFGAVREIAPQGREELVHPGVNNISVRHAAVDVHRSIETAWPSSH